MAVRIRLRRIGKGAKKRPHFRISVFDARRARDSKIIEELGFYNPINKQIKINLERLNYWIKNGAQLSETVECLVKRYRKEQKHVTSESSG
ncbi:MAG: 30S ribosomal protein S16 [Candidatus Omnitrophica bacterium]|nr:30S ribosomal protein S16 [Candidatus Omnitrophota bacterium]